MKLKPIAIAAFAASLSGLAHADLTSGTSVNNGSVSLLAVDITTNNWYIRDTGFLLNDFIPNSVTTASGDGGVTGNKTPETGLTLNAGNTTSFADASFGAWAAAQTAGNVRWVLSGYDLAGLVATNLRRMLVSSANASETFLNSNVDGFVATGNAGGLFNFFNPSANEFSVTGTGGAAGFLTAWGLGTDAMATLDSAVSLYYVARNGASGGTANPANATKFGNSGGFATVSLASNGDFSYVLAPAEVTAVPVPAAAWLLGAGLMGLGGAIRRRKAAALA